MTTASEIKTVGIVGTGVIGDGWAARLLARGHRISAWDPSPGFETRLTEAIDRAWPMMERIGLAKVHNKSGLSFAGSLAEACRDADFIQESVPENLDLKREVHQQIDAAARPDAIVVSSSSGLLPTDIQAAYSHPERMLIGHPFNPVYLLPLVEVVPGKHTSSSTVAAAREFFAGAGMYPLILDKEIEGYLSDRLQEALWREALHLVNEGVATTSQLDDAIVYGPGLRWAIMGTCLTFHLAGGEGGMRHMLEQFGPALKLPWTKLEAPELTEPLIERMVAGTASQAANRSTAELERLRDECLCAIMQALAKFEAGAGTLIEAGS